MTGTVQVWLLSTEQTPEIVEGFSGLLDADELARRDELIESGVRAEFVLCRAALRQLLGQALGIAPESLRFEIGPHGKPRLADDALHFNLSHSDGFAAIALAERPVGVDVQQQRAGAGLDRMAERYYSPIEVGWLRSAPDTDEFGRRFSRLWSRKEACLKVTGGRLIPSLVWPLFTFADGTFGWTDPAVTGRDLAVPAGCHGAVAVAGSAPFELQTDWWTGTPATGHTAGRPLSTPPMIMNGVPMPGTRC